MRSAALSRVALLVVGVCLGAALPACSRQGCVGGDDGRCLPPPACAALSYACDGGHVAVRRFGPRDLDRAFGPKAAATVGDILIENDRVRIVLDAPGHPQGLAPTGGSIIDFAPIEGGDQANGIFHAAGVLPRDAARYVSVEIIDHAAPAQPAELRFVAVVFRGHLDGDKRVTVVTRYELRPCEPGVRVRTDLYNGAPDPNTLFVADGLFWGDRGVLPFVPLRGQGFLQPELDLLELGEAWREWPWLAGRSQAEPFVSYAVVPCSSDRGAGFNESTLSAAGGPLAPTMPGDGVVYERFIAATPGPGLAPAVAEALHVRTAVHGEPAAVRVRGRMLWRGQPVDARAGRAASVLVYERAPGDDPDDPTRRLPWSEAVPGPDGVFVLDLPPNRSYRLLPHAFGRPSGPAASFVVGSTGVDIGDISVERPARLRVTVNSAPLERARFVQIVLTPARASSGAAPSLYGQYGGCDPMLGPPHGGSPACNRALTIDGQLELLVPAGHFYVYATRGPFASIDRAEVTLAPGDDQAITLTSRIIPGLLPDGALSGDFHVHGAASYDTSIPDQDRVVSFIAAGVDVIAATDHDVVTSYADTVAALGVGHRLVVMPGVEMTPNLLWFEVPGEDFPRTLGHFNFWPLARDLSLPRNGAPWDELVEPGQMMDAVAPLFASGVGVRQANHPWSDDKLGRDQGFLRAIKYDPRTPIQPGASFAADVLLRRPGGGARNIDWDTQEVMTGASRRDWLRYRALWFSLLSQGFLKAGVANSDTHSLMIEPVGFPRSLIFGRHSVASFDVDAFNEDVIGGHLVGTNGPVLQVSLDGADGSMHGPGLEPFVPAPAAVLSISVATAPWIPASEVRIIVNGVVARRVEIAATSSGAARLGATAVRAQVSVPLAAILPASGDAWLVVEAGMPQDTPVDTDDPPDGVPDFPEPDPAVQVRDPSHPLFDLEVIAPGVWPTAFTNPFVLDLDGGGWTAPGLPASP